jgi:hypothetical protein
MDYVFPVIILDNLKACGPDGQVSDDGRSWTPFALWVRIIAQYCLLNQPLLPLGFLFVSFGHGI